MRAFVEDMLDDFRTWLTGPVGRWRAVRLARSPIGGVVLVLLCCAVYLPGQFRIPPVDRDEARFAQASRQMYESVALPEADRDDELHSGGLIVPMVQGKPRLNKPPLIYWAQTASAFVWTAGDPLADAIWMYRLPSALFATLAVLATWRVGCSIFDPRAGLVGAALLAVCPMVVWDAHQARADQLLLACTTLAMWALWEVWSRAHRRSDGKPSAGLIWPIVFWIAIGLGVLAKGPITPMVAALTALALAFSTRRWAWLRATKPLVGLGILALLVGPWVWLVIDRVGFDEYWSIVFGETVGRSGSAAEGHWGPPGYHLFFLVVLFWPGVLLTALALGRAWSRARGVMLDPIETDPDGTDPVEIEAIGLTAEGPIETGVIAGPSLIARLWLRVRAFAWAITRPARGRGGELFCLAWIGPAWIVFELVATKLPHYTLPLYPPVALLTARALLSAADGKLRGAAGDSARLGHWIWLVVGGLLVVAAPVGASLLGGLPVIVFGALVALAGAEMLRRAWRRLGMGDFGGAQTWSVGAMAVAFAGLLGVVLPSSKGIWISPQLTEIIDEARGADRPVAAVGYHEDSLIFLTRGRLERIDDAGAWIRAHRDGLLVARPEDVLSDSLGVATLTKIGDVRGVNYSRGEVVVLGVYEADR